MSFSGGGTNLFGPDTRRPSSLSAKSVSVPFRPAEYELEKDRKDKKKINFKCHVKGDSSGTFSQNPNETRA